MFTRLVKGQLAVFTVLTVIVVAVVGLDYLNLPRLLGFEQYPIIARFRDADGLYPGGDVTYRGVPVGKISAVTFGPDADAADVHLAINDDVRLPAELTARATSMSAIGEQSVELVPARAGGPYLAPGAVIPPDRTAGLEPTAALLDNLDGLLSSVPKPQLTDLLDQVGTGFSHGPADTGPLLAATEHLVDAATRNLAPTTRLVHGLGPFLDTQLATGPDLRNYTGNLARFTDELRRADPRLRGVLEHGGPGLHQARSLVNRVRSDLPYLLDDLTDTARVVRVYLPGLQQVLVIYPATAAALQSALTGPSAEPGSIHLGLRPNIGQPPTCFTGFLPYPGQRDFNDQTTRGAIPDNLYCKVAPDDPRAARGARNTPCLNAPGRRAASVEECLGRPIGSLSRFETSSPAGQDAVTPARSGSPAPAPTTYDPGSGRLLAPDGVLYQLSGVGDDGPRPVTTWQQLLLK